jgi:hypothetical protein
MDNNEIIHVAIAPPVMVESNLIKAVAAIIDKDLYTTQSLLAGKMPRIIAHYQAVQTAESVAERLRDLGFSVILCKDSELRQTSPSIFKARSLRFGQGEIEFKDKRGTDRIIKTEDVFLIIKGIAQIQSEIEVIKTRKELNLTATLLSGGIPIRRKVEEKTKETSIRPEYFMRLYLRKTPETYVEIAQYDFDYSCLEANISANTLANFNTLSAKIKEYFPRSVFDDGLTESSRLSVSPTMSLKNKDIQCKLIYLFHAAVNDPDSSI